MREECFQFDSNAAGFMRVHRFPPELNITGRLWRTIWN
jgi:hypothetical protein